ncbi:MAG: protein kinase [Polyangiaceae bacterium]|nr:protein kinase [Polyangiaceae bacterium]
MKVLHPESTRDRVALQRFLTLTRLAGQLQSDSLPALVFAGEVEGRWIVAHEYSEGQPLAARVGRTGPMHINEARPIIKGIIEGLLSLHDEHLVHGALSLDNVISVRAGGGDPKITLLDAGTARLRMRQRRDRQGLSATGGNPKTVSPEQIRGADADNKSDTYSLGALMFELLTGKPVFEGELLDVAFGHIQAEPPVPSTVAPRGWVTPDIDALVLGMLSKDPGARGLLKEIADRLDDLGRNKKSEKVSEEAIDELEQALMAEPSNTETAISLEGAVDRGATAERVAQAFRLAASMIDDPIAIDDKRALLLRAARLFEADKESIATAAEVYLELLSLDPKDSVSIAGLEEAHRRTGNYEALLEMLLSRAEVASSDEARARLMADIGKVYLQDLSDPEQATVAYSQAFCDNPTDEYAADVERAAGSTEDYWAEALSALHEAAANPNSAAEKSTKLMLKAGVWYQAKVQRADLALPCFQQVLSVEPSNEVALSGLTEIYRKAQQWQELGMMLTHRADAAGTPSEARELRTEAGEILEERIGDLAGARSIYESVLADDPSHQRAGDGLARILEKSGDYEALVKLLNSRVDAESTAAAIITRCRIGEIYEDHLDDEREAKAAYEKALESDSTSLDALRGLERVFTKSGKYEELLENLNRQVEIAVTPKQKIILLERIAAVNEEEFLNHEAAAQALELALEADPGRVAAMSSLINHLRVLERWEEASSLYERQMDIVEEPSERIALAMAWGRMLAEKIGSPERSVRAYEMVLDVDADHQAALEALAKVREAAGDADRAVEAIVSLAEQSEEPVQSAEQYVRAAKLVEERGDRDAAIEFYKLALDADPENREIAAHLRAAYVLRGDINAAVELIERELDIVEGDLAQAKLAGEMARLQKDRLKDDVGAESSAKRALRLDPSNADALLVLGDLTFEQERFLEASSFYGRIADRVETMGKEVAVPVLERFVDALSQSGSTEVALKAMDVLLRLAPEDRGALARVAKVTFESGAPKRAVEVVSDYLKRFSAEISDEEKGLFTYRLGASLRRSGDVKDSIAKLNEASELDPSLTEPLVELALAYTDLEDWKGVVKTKSRQLDVAEDDLRVDLLLELGELYAEKLNDPTQAARSYVAALEERPEDRRLLSKLMQLYSADKDWNKLVDIVAKLADMVDEPIQRAKYLHTAALLTAREIGDAEQAIVYFERVLELQPENAKALAELIEIQRSAGNYNAVEDLLKQQLASAEEADDNQLRVKVLDQLGELYQNHIVDNELAAQAYEAAHELDAENQARLDKLAAIYKSDPEGFKEKGILLQEHLLSQNPFRQESYKALRSIYSVAQDADASWNLCQTLSVLKLAEPDEENFYQRMRAETAAPAQDAFQADDWHERIMHPTLDPLLTGIFALIEPAVIKARGQSADKLGVRADMLLDPAQSDAPLAVAIDFARRVMGLELPAIYANPEDMGGLAFLLADQPSITMGQVGLSPEVPPQVAAFVAARQLAYLRPGMYMRQFVQTGTAMKAWLFAAIKLSSPAFPVAADLEGAVNDALSALRAHLSADARDHLASTVSKLIQSGTALDLKKWVAAVDLTADRAGFIIAHDLATASDVIRASEDPSVSVPSEERFRELVIYSTSSLYFDMRRRLGITLEN